MYKYTGVLLVEDSDGIPHVVTAPPYKASEGQLAVWDGNVGKVVKCATMKMDSEEYAILTAMLPVQEADGLYDPRYLKDEENADPYS